MEVERTYVMIKPDGVQRGLVGNIISRFENKGLKLIALKMMKIDNSLASLHYLEHKNKSFYKELIKFITSGPVIGMVLEGPDAVNIVRKLVGATAPSNAEPGSIRGDYVVFTTFNIIHASDSHESSKREIDLFFKDSELQNYKMEIKRYLF